MAVNYQANMEYLKNGKKGRILIASHRGKFGGGILENILAALELALKQDADILEIDIARTADGELIGFHDQAIDRLITDTGLVSEKTFLEIKQLPLRNTISDFNGQYVNTLDEILEFLKERGFGAAPNKSNQKPPGCSRFFTHRPVPDNTAHSFVSTP
jgi:glycerophosphoryl diester phosphodiesterase